MFSIFAQSEVEIEDRLPERPFSFLESLGHDVKQNNAFRSYFGSVQQILR